MRLTLLLLGASAPGWAFRVVAPPPRRPPIVPPPLPTLMARCMSATGSPAAHAACAALRPRASPSAASAPRASMGARGAQRPRAAARWISGVPILHVACMSVAWGSSAHAHSACPFSSASISGVRPLASTPSGGALRCTLRPKPTGVLTSLLEATGWGAAACDPREPLLKPPPPSVRGARGTPLERLQLMFVTDFYWCYPVLKEERALQFGYCQGE